MKKKNNLLNDNIIIIESRVSLHLYTKKNF